MKWQSYEETVKNIYCTLGKDSEMKVLGYGNSCKIKGKSGIEHQIDVLIQHTVGIHNYKTAIECKYWKKKVDKDILMKLEEIVKDCNFNKGVVVSKSGFTKDAINFAKCAGIGLVELREFSDKDWGNIISRIKINLIIQSPRINLECVKLDTNKYSEEEIQKITKHCFVENSNEILISVPNMPNKTLADLMNEFQDTLDIQNEKIKKEYNFPSESCLKFPNGKILYIRQIVFTGQIHQYQNNIDINADDFVWLKMKAIFENKEYTIFKDGNVVEDSRQ